MKKKIYEGDGGRIIVSRVHEEYYFLHKKNAFSCYIYNKPEIKPYPTWSTAILPALKTPLCCFWH